MGLFDLMSLNLDLTGLSDWYLALFGVGLSLLICLEIGHCLLMINLSFYDFANLLFFAGVFAFARWKFLLSYFWKKSLEFDFQGCIFFLYCNLSRLMKLKKGICHLGYSIDLLTLFLILSSFQFHILKLFISTCFALCFLKITHLSYIMYWQILIVDSFFSFQFLFNPLFLFNFTKWFSIPLFIFLKHSYFELLQ